MDHKKKLFSRELRKESTLHEIKVWEKLRDRRFLNLKFRRQHVIEGFVVDFYCHQLRLAIEIDGGIHERQQDYDDLRQHLIECEGIRFIRVTNEEVIADMDKLFKKIIDTFR
ncbi:MAG: endonuclease domain-containing protein [Spirochaetes bacterium]|nr:endonuclease domain-containing protein [Spirochaetota bacterium]